MGDLHQHAAAVSSLGVGTHRAAMVEVQKDLQSHFDNVVRLTALHVGDKADAADLLQRRVIKTLRGRQAGVPNEWRFRRAIR